MTEAELLPGKDSEVDIMRLLQQTVTKYLKKLKKTQKFLQRNRDIKSKF